MSYQDTVETLTEFFNYVDTDHDGWITVDEIKQACAVDIDGDGVISEVELDATSLAWINNVPLIDLDKDMKITLEELLKYNIVN